AERLGKLRDLGKTIRTRVAHTIAKLPENALVFANLHPFDLDDSDLADPRAPLSGHAKRVVLEITERASLDGIKDARKKIAALRSLGFRIALDDLGAGHAGLSTFAKVEPDMVKLDMSLTRGADKEPIRRQVIASMVELCRKLKMEVVTEGIETPEERDAIVGAGCDLLQGYLFARPSREIFTAKF
ncbi:MAG TPA: EAL domain-containing protein, partial [bacterium]|nr:EAL domain-containing protein [bacterium]